MKRTELLNQHVTFVHGRAMKAPVNGREAEMEDVWKLVIVDKGTGDEVFFTFDDAVKQVFVQQLTGVILAT